MKYQIMIKMLMLLLSRRKVRAREIAERYEISLRSVYRYVEELAVAGIPIDVARGRYGGISIADTYRLPVGYFTKDEYNAAINALSAMSSQVNDDAIITALEKLQQQVKKFSEKMAVCERAVNESLCLDIDYISRSGEHSRRIIDPHVLIFKQNVWYVYAFCHTKQSFRTFKIGRIKSARFTGKGFKKREISREEIPLSFGYRSDELVELVLEIEKDKLPDAEEWIGIDNIEPRGNKFIAEVAVPDDDGLVSKILGFGGGVKILSPESLRQKVTSAAQRVIDSI